MTGHLLLNCWSTHLCRDHYNIMVSDVFSFLLTKTISIVHKLVSHHPFLENVEFIIRLLGPRGAN
jgi:hypothetical protein